MFEYEEYKILNNEQNYELIRDNWLECDKKGFVEYIQSLSKGTISARFEKNILKTNYECVAVPSKEVDRIVRQIHKGNFLSFIDLWITDNYTCLIIIGKLIAKIKNFELFRVKLLQYLKYVDCWAGCDCLKLNISKNDQEQFFALANELIKSTYPFFRRFGLII